MLKIALRDKPQSKDKIHGGKKEDKPLGKKLAKRGNFGDKKRGIILLGSGLKKKSICLVGGKEKAEKRFC